MKVIVKVPFKAEIGLSRGWDGYRSYVSSKYCLNDEFTEELDTDELGDAYAVGEKGSLVLVFELPEVEARLKKKAIEIARASCDRKPYRCKYEKAEIIPVLLVVA